MKLPRKRWLLLTPILILAVFTIGFLFWVLYIPSPMDEALAATVSNSSVTVSNNEWLAFRPRNEEVRLGLIFYPGARVDYRAYSPAMKAIAERGYLVVVPPMPLNMALFAPERAADVKKAYPEIKKWVIGGHSMGGAFAAQYAAQHPEKITGLILWAAYPPGSTSFKYSEIPVLSIYGSFDEIATPDEIMASRTILPSNTEFIEITGGNHAQFGWYGNQSGDGQPSISREEQQNQVIDLTVKFLAKIE